jgi:hypothetical protein
MRLIEIHFFDSCSIRYPIIARDRRPDSFGVKRSASERSAGFGGQCVAAKVAAAIGAEGVGSPTPFDPIAIRDAAVGDQPPQYGDQGTYFGALSG